MTLRFDRFLNLIYWWTIRFMSVDDRKKFDRALTPPPDAVTGEPSWWLGDEDAAQSGLALARSLGLPVQLPAG